ncbi:MAG TPA: hypothetical protein VGF94_04135 [Kofleriaceae bacterium]|jgi:hypothetical protein
MRHAIIALAACAPHTLDHAELAKRELPGFSLLLPSGEAKLSPAYADGELELARAGGYPNATVNVTWYFGDQLHGPELLEMGQQAVRAANPSATGKAELVTHDGHELVRIPYEYDEWASSLACGARSVTLATERFSLDDHLRMVNSLDCHPIAQKEHERVPLPIAIDLPGFTAVDRDPTTRVLSQGDAHVMLDLNLHETGTDETKAFVASFVHQTEPDAVTTELSTDLYAFEGSELAGWVRAVRCGDTKTMIVAVVPASTPADDLLARIRAAHCLP